MRNKTLSNNSIRKILKKEGAEFVSENAIIEMRKLVEEYSTKIAKKAIKNALYSGRKTIKKRDIKLY